MIKFGTTFEDGHRALFLGLSFGNLKKFRAQPCDTFIKIASDETGLGGDVILFSCRTEKEGVGMLQKMFDIPDEILAALVTGGNGSNR
jgi:hypothetical protein